jgi:hypothetical protein
MTAIRHCGPSPKGWGFFIFVEGCQRAVVS